MYQRASACCTIATEHHGAGIPLGTLTRPPDCPPAAIAFRLPNTEATPIGLSHSIGYVPMDSQSSDVISLVASTRVLFDSE